MEPSSSHNNGCKNEVNMQQSGHSYTYINSLCTFSADFFNYEYYMTENSSTEHSNMIVFAKFRLI